MTKRKAKFYVVWQGREAGIYDSWNDCEAQVKGVSAQYKGFATREEAEKALAEGFEKHITAAPRTSPFTKPNPIDTPENMLLQGIKLPALAVDAACSGNPGIMEFRGVIADTGTEVFHRGPYVNGTNNIGEFFGIGFGIGVFETTKIRLGTILR